MDDRTSLRASKKLTIEKECNDVFFLLLWLGATIYAIVVADIWGSDALKENPAVEVGGDIVEYGSTSHAKLIYNLMLEEIGIAAALSLAGLVILMYAAQYLVWAAITASVLMNFVVGGFMSRFLWESGEADSYYWVPAVVFGFFGFAIAAWAYCVRNRIDFASGSLSVACTAVLTQPLLFVIALLMLGLQVAWICLALLALLGAKTPPTEITTRMSPMAFPSLATW